MLSGKQCEGLVFITAITVVTLSLGTHVCTCTLSAAPTQHTCTCTLPVVLHMCRFTHTHIGMHISQQQIYMQVNIFLPHSLVTALLFPLPPPPPHLSVWERPLGFVLSVTSASLLCVCACACARACVCAFTCTYVHTYMYVYNIFQSNNGKLEKILSHQKKMD